MVECTLHMHVSDGDCLEFRDKIVILVKKSKIYSLDLG